MARKNPTAAKVETAAKLTSAPVTVKAVPAEEKSALEDSMLETIAKMQLEIDELKEENKTLKSEVARMTADESKLIDAKFDALERVAKLEATCADGFALYLEAVRKHTAV